MKLYRARAGGALRGIVAEEGWKTRDHTSVIWPAFSHSAGININKSLRSVACHVTAIAILRPTTSKCVVRLLFPPARGH